ncbi:hypothetical protein FSARC_4386 [Fusarium sarcochroum]|uniref:Heterokaryon incompatibility domain-containing protein n=1 Tax=Fusarium sarcochroum TaxID=1208366 RepID=A0A8H4U1N3_9HYPO|nr:hypothetical protein FSARC_4386 [Fusarium sarcochroum]
MASALCERCKSLNLSVAKFRIKDKSGDENDRSTLPELTSSRRFLGTMTQIRDSAESCKLCELIADTVRDASVPHMDGVACHLLWEMDGRTSAEPLVGHKGNRTRRLRVSWSDTRLKSYEAYVMLAAPPKYDKSDVDYPGLLNDETQFLGRRIGSSHNKKNLVPKLGIEDPFRDTLNEPYFGVIDMENESLVPLPYSDDGVDLHFEAYATVSYVWGSGHSRQHATRISNIQSRQQQPLLEPQRSSDALDLWQLNCYNDNHQPRQTVVNYGQGVCLMLHRPAETSIETTQWNKRAWTFQERLLSKRCLIFTEGRIFFQCRSTGMSEDVFSDRLGRGWSLDLVRAPLQMLSQLKLRAMWFYAHCVALYTVRELYEPFDILAAFSGMCKLIEQTIRAPFVFGLPTSHFDLALLWQPVGKSSRLEKASVSDDPKYKDMRFPSWSWCGWNSQGATYDSEMVGGCLADVRDWISTHTWIDWHIRDGYGTLRRVWDTRHAEEDASEDVRWRGYKSATPRQKANHTKDEEESTTSDESSTSSSEIKYTTVIPRGKKMSENRSAAVITDSSSPYRKRKESRTIPSRLRSNSLTSKSKAVQRLQRRLGVGFSSQTDKFGRSYLGHSTLPRASTASSPGFTLTLPEDPYNVLTTEATQTSMPSSSVEEFPDQPFLQFFTWRADFHVIRPDIQSNLDPKQLSNGPDQTEPVQDLCRCEISDRRGDKCGSVMVDSEWLRNKERERDTMCKFIAISDAKDFTDEEFPDWTYYIPKERIESEWDLYFVLLVEFYPEEGIYRRVALGKAFKAAFAHSKEEEWKEIILG